MVGAFLNERLIIAARATRRSVVLLGLAIASFVGPTIAAAGELNIYSHRQQFLLQPFLDAFTAETGIRTKVVYASKGLAQRLQPRAADLKALGARGGQHAERQWTSIRGNLMHERTLVVHVKSAEHLHEAGSARLCGQLGGERRQLELRRQDQRRRRRPQHGSRWRCHPALPSPVPMGAGSALVATGHASRN